MPYAIYGKRTKPILNTQTHEFMGPDAKFAALDYNGCRVTKLVDAGTYATVEDAQEIIDKRPVKDGVILEVRKIK